MMNSPLQSLQSSIGASLNAGQRAKTPLSTTRSDQILSPFTTASAVPSTPLTTPSPLVGPFRVSPYVVTRNPQSGATNSDRIKVIGTGYTPEIISRLKVQMALGRVDSPYYDRELMEALGANNVYRTLGMTPPPSTIIPGSEGDSGAAVPELDVFGELESNDTTTQNRNDHVDGNFIRVNEFFPVLGNRRDPVQDFNQLHVVPFTEIDHVSADADPTVA